MKGLVKTGLTLGLGALIDYLQTEKPLRSWLKKRREAKGKDPLLDPAKQDELADEGLERARKELERLK